MLSVLGTAHSSPTRSPSFLPPKSSWQTSAASVLSLYHLSVPLSLPRSALRVHSIRLRKTVSFALYGVHVLHLQTFAMSPRVLKNKNKNKTKLGCLTRSGTVEPQNTRTIVTISRLLLRGRHQVTLNTWDGLHQQQDLAWPTLYASLQGEWCDRPGPRNRIICPCSLPNVACLPGGFSRG